MSTECPERAHDAGSPGCLSPHAFDETLLRKVELVVAADQLARLPGLARDEQTESTYVPAELTLDGQALGTVGLRFKGAHGTLSSCIGDDGTILCSKMSYKLKFDAFDDHKRWQGLKKVNLHSMVRDRTLMHEHLAYRLFRQLGVVAPRASHAEVHINGENLGVFAFTEAPDGRFTADRFAPAGDGNLYKEVWPVATSAEDYQAALETNEEQAQDHHGFVSFAQALQGEGRDGRAAVIDRFTDRDYLLRYLAADRLLSNWDGVTTFYCGDVPDTPCQNHNYYWYVDEAQRRFWLVPWDLDLTFALETEQELFMPAWYERPDDCSRRIPWHGGWRMAPGCDALFEGLASLGPEPYRAAFAQMLDGPFEVSALRTEIDRIEALLRDAVGRDPSVDPLAWQAAVQDLERSLPLLVQKGQRMRDGDTTLPMLLQVHMRNDFEQGSELGFVMGSSLEPNPATLAARQLNQQAPLHGKHDARAEFTYRNGKAPWAYLNFGLRMQSAQVDLSGMRALTLVLKADGPRRVRVELDLVEPDGSTQPRPGWSVDVSQEPRSVTLEFGELDRLGPVRGVMIQVDPHGLDRDGFLPAGQSDQGFLQLDDLEFIPR